MKLYDLIINTVITIAITSIIIVYMLTSEPSEQTFVSFNDGSIACNTIEIKKGMNKEQLAVALKIGAEYMNGDMGKRPGCVNYEFEQ